MGGSSSQLASGKLQGREKKGIIAPSSKTIFDYYAEVPALVKISKRPGEALRLFQKAKDGLEEKLKDSYAKLRPPLGAEKHQRSDGQSPIASYHALLALVLWLFPNNAKLSRVDQASSMFNHASAAVVTSSKSGSTQIEPLAIGLLVQLRILPFLIRSKKVNEAQLTRIRQVASSLSEQLLLDKQVSTTNLGDSTIHIPIRSQRHDIAGLLLEGIGFSYFQFERNSNVAANFLSRASGLLSETTKNQITRIGRRRKDSQKENYAKLSFYRAITAVAFWDLGASYESMAEGSEGDDMLSFVRLTRANYEKARYFAKLTPWHIYSALSAYNESGTYAKESEYQPDARKAREFMKKAVRLGDEALVFFGLWSAYEADFMGGSWVAAFYQQLAALSESRTGKKLMAHSLSLAKKAEKLMNEGRLKNLRYNDANVGDVFFNIAEYYKKAALKDIREDRRKSSSKDRESINTLRKALDNCLKSRSFFREERHSNRAVEALLLGGDICYELMNSLNLGPAQKEYYARLAKRQCTNSIKISSKVNWNERVAEANWRLAQIFDREGRFEDSASYFLKAHESYDFARKSSEHGRVFESLVNYMLAWNRIELAKVAHRSSNFSIASKNYLDASRFVAETKRWNHVSHLFRAESLMDSGEQASLEDRSQESIDYFSKAIESLSRYTLEIKNSEYSYGGLSSGTESASLLTIFCRARMILEKSKDDYRLGNVAQSINGLESAEGMFRDLALSSSLRSDPLRANELESLSSLCKAMKSFQRAQLLDDPNMYTDARQIFESASVASNSKTLKPLLSGLGHFAAFLYYSKQLEKSLETSLDPEKIVECDEALEHAEVMFRKLGNKSFLNMLRASKHILDATIKMNAAEREMEDAETRTRLYTQAQRSLSAASRYYEQLGSSKRVKESLKMIGAVRNHQRLIPLAHDIIAEVASSQIIYSAIASSSAFEQVSGESASVIDTAYLDFDFEIIKPYVTADEPLNCSISLSNLGKKAAIAVRIDELLPEGFDIVGSPYKLNGDNRSIRLNVRVEPSTTKKIILSAKTQHAGDYTWHPSLIYLDSERNYRIARGQTSRAVVEPSMVIDIKATLAAKAKMEQELADLTQNKSALEQENIEANAVQIQKLTEERYSFKEKISKIDEEILRIKSEFQSMQQELERTRSDITLLRSKENDISTRQDLATLEMEERLLTSKIERRRRLLESAEDKEKKLP